MPTEVDSEWLWQLSESCRDDLLDKGIERERVRSAVEIGEVMYACFGLGMACLLEQ